jgi:hypothetical protein
MDALLVEGETVTPVRRTVLGERGLYDEKWLQELLATHPEVIPIDLIDPGAGRVVPLCREFPIPRRDRTVFLDLLGVTPVGRLVLVECKLWRNPQARREVIGQILEYAALLRCWSFADLTARLKRALRWTGANPLYEHVRAVSGAVEEARFVDAVSRSLTRGEFDLIVAGDGIHPDLAVIGDHLAEHSTLASRLALVEFQLWSDAERTLVVPSLRLRTEVLQHRIVTNADGVPVALKPTAEEVERSEPGDPGRMQQREENRNFWQCFIDEVQFDHPDQPRPRHGGNNWVRLALPEPAGWLTLYRSEADAGLFFTLAGEEGAAVFERLATEGPVLQEETQLALEFGREREVPFEGRVSVRRRWSGEESDLRAWLAQAANAMISAFRPRLAAYAGEKI